MTKENPKRKRPTGGWDANVFANELLDGFDGSSVSLIRERKPAQSRATPMSSSGDWVQTTGDPPYQARRHGLCMTSPIRHHPVRAKSARTREHGVDSELALPMKTSHEDRYPAYGLDGPPEDPLQEYNPL